MLADIIFGRGKWSSREISARMNHRPGDTYPPQQLVGSNLPAMIETSRSMLQRAEARHAEIETEISRLESEAEKTAIVIAGLRDLLNTLDPIPEIEGLRLAIEEALKTSDDPDIHPARDMPSTGLHGHVVVDKTT